MIALCIPGTPVPFARAGSHGSQRYTPGKQRAHMVDIGLRANVVMAGRGPMIGPLQVQARFVYEVPKSWTKAEKATAKWKTSVPDADNLVKLCKDALNGIVWVDDAQVVEITAQKVYGVRSETVITVQPLWVGAPE